MHTKSSFEFQGAFCGLLKLEQSFECSFYDMLYYCFQIVAVIVEQIKHSANRFQSRHQENMKLHKKSMFIIIN